MARAKRTERAEARRRYRAELQAQAEAEQGGDGEADAAAQPVEPTPAGRLGFARSLGRSLGRGPAPTAARVAVAPTTPTGRTAPPSRSGTASAAVPPKERVGFLQAFKLAYRPVHYREDLRLIVPLITRTNAIWPVAVLCVVGMAILVQSSSQNDITTQAGLMVVTYSPLLPGMLAGFLAPRASWLAGAIAGLMSGLSFAVLFLAGTPVLVSPQTRRPEGIEIPLFLLQILFYAVPIGLLIGALSGWYKRFLQLTGPSNAARARSKQPARKTAARRR